MKRIKTAIATVLAVVLCFVAVNPVMGAETSGEAMATVVETTTSTDETATPTDEPSIIEESADLQKEEQPAAGGDLSGDSKVTWTDSTMPAAFDITSVRLKRQAYLTTDPDGYMRVAYNGKSIIIEYYDDDFHMTKQGYLSMELEEWGGFFKGEDAYYIVEGQNNLDCVDGTEVLRIIKYDFSWNRLGAGSILAQEGWDYAIRTPFVRACLEMDEVNGKLYVITGREGYIDENLGQGHQGMMLIRMDEKTFDTEIAYGDFFHSFMQHIAHSGTDLFICQLSEGYYCTSLSVFDSNRAAVDYAEYSDVYEIFSKWFSVLNYGGQRTSPFEVPTYATADDLVLSSDKAFCLGVSIDQSQYDYVTSATAHNIYLSVTPLSDLDSDHTTVKWLTDYAGDGKSFISLNITKVNDDRFLVAWEEYAGENEDVNPSAYLDPLSNGVLHYLFVDGSGNKVSEEFTEAAMISECHPILKDNRIVYYASTGNCLDFYTIDAQSGEFNKTVIRTAGGNATWNYEAGVLSISGTGKISIDPSRTSRYPTSKIQDYYSMPKFYNCWRFVQNDATDLNIEEGITSIGESSFQDFGKLASVNLPEGLKSIGRTAFYGCDRIWEISIPDSVEEIGDDILWTGAKWSSDGSHVTHAKIIGNCTSYAIEYAEKNNISYRAQHKWDSEITKATTTENGKIVEKCKSCGAVASEEVICYPETITLSKTSFSYNGNVQRPEVTVVGSDGEIISDDNYTLSFSEGCKLPGTYSVEIDFQGNYSGTVTKEFSITLGKTTRGDMFNLANNVKVTWKEVPGAKYYKVYREGITDPSESLDEPVIVTERLIGWDSKPGLTNGHAYRYKIVASLTGAGDPSGDSALSYSKVMYRLKTVVIRSAKNTAPGKVTVKYDKTTSGDSYVLQYCEREDMVGAKTKVVLGAENTSYVIGGLKKGKTYYISIRVRKKVDGIDYYTTFGVPKKVKITK